MSNESTNFSARRVAAMAIAVVFALGTLVSVAGADTKSELASAKNKLDALVTQIQSEQAVANGLQADANAVAAKIDAVHNSLAQTQADIVRTQAAVTRHNNRIAGLQGQLDTRARVAYESGPGSTFEFLLGSTSISDFSDRLEIINHAARSDQDVINEVTDERSQLAQQQLVLQQKKGQLRSQQADYETQQADLQSKLQAAQSAINQLNADRASADALVGKLKAQAAKEAAALAAARAAQQQNSGGQSVNGHPFSLCPVDQSRAYSDSFGAPRYGGGYHLHAGVDIFASAGIPIRAPFGGLATDASNTLGGLSVIVTGSSGWVYNAHMTRIGQLGPVVQGTVIGYVGNTGDAAGGPTHDHFEWHPNVFPNPLYRSVYGITSVGSAIDPFPYLNQVC